MSEWRFSLFLDIHQVPNPIHQVSKKDLFFSPDLTSGQNLHYLSSSSHVVPQTYRNVMCAQMNSVRSSTSQRKIALPPAWNLRETLQSILRMLGYMIKNWWSTDQLLNYPVCSSPSAMEAHCVFLGQSLYLSLRHLIVCYWKWGSGRREHICITLNS